MLAKTMEKGPVINTKEKKNVAWKLEDPDLLLLKSSSIDQSWKLEFQLPSQDAFTQRVGRGHSNSYTITGNKMMPFIGSL